MNESTFMRDYYRTKYEDLVWTLDSRNEKCRDANKLMQHLECELIQKLEEKCPEMMELYDKFSEEHSTWLKLILEECYILGVQDREQSLKSQKWKQWIFTLWVYLRFRKAVILKMIENKFFHGIEWLWKNVFHCCGISKAKINRLKNKLDRICKINFRRC